MDVIILFNIIIIILSNNFNLNLCFIHIFGPVVGQLRPMSPINKVNSTLPFSLNVFRKFKSDEFKAYFAELSIYRFFLKILSTKHFEILFGAGLVFLVQAPHPFLLWIWIGNSPHRKSFARYYIVYHTISFLVSNLSGKCNLMVQLSHFWI